MQIAQHHALDGGRRKRREAQRLLLLLLQTSSFRAGSLYRSSTIAGVAMCVRAARITTARRRLPTSHAASDQGSARRWRLVTDGLAPGGQFDLIANISNAIMASRWWARVTGRAARQIVKPSLPTSLQCDVLDLILCEARSTASPLVWSPSSRQWNRGVELTPARHTR